jgi:aldose 1-epimerase
MKAIQTTLNGEPIIELYNEHTGAFAQILPTYGGILSKLILTAEGEKHTIIDCGETFEAITQDPSYPSTILFPWPNRIRNGKYSFEENAYTLPINETGNNNALHGLVYNVPYQIQQCEVIGSNSTCILVHRYEGTEAGFPFPFSIAIEYNLGLKGLTLKIDVLNTGKTAMPYALGWHPYFQFQNETQNDWELKIDAEKMFLSDSQMIPIGHGVYQYPDKWNDLKGKGYDTVFKIQENKATVKSLLRSKKSGRSIEVWQDGQKGEYEYIVVYTPPGGKRIAIEPMTANTDAYNNKQGFQTLAPGVIKTLACGVNLK